MCSVTSRLKCCSRQSTFKCRRNHPAVCPTLSAHPSAPSHRTLIVVRRVQSALYNEEAFGRGHLLGARREFPGGMAANKRCAFASGLSRNWNGVVAQARSSTPLCLGRAPRQPAALTRRSFCTLTRMGSIDVIDTHLHVWDGTAVPFVQGKEPPESLRNAGSIEALLNEMQKAGVKKCIAIQPINYGFDHTYLSDCISKHPKIIHGMMLVSGTTNSEHVELMHSLKEHGNRSFVGMRMNPSLFMGGQLDSNIGRLMYSTAADLDLIVGFMCFDGGLAKHYEAITNLIASSPSTKCVIDHWGFFRADPAQAPSAALAHDEVSWNNLLALAKYPQVYVKISALFRVSRDAENMYGDLQSRFEALIEAFGTRRLMYGSDFPFVAQFGYKEHLDAVKQMCDNARLSERDIANLFSKTAERLFFM